MKKCPFCAEEIQDEAIKCRHCGSVLNSPSPVSNTPTDGSLLEKRNLSQQQVQILQFEFEKKKKSVGIAYLLWFFLGGIGIHQLYLGKKWLTITLIVSWIVLFAVSPTGSFEAAIVPIMTLVFCGFKLLIDLFTLSSQVRACNDALEKKIISELK